MTLVSNKLIDPARGWLDIKEVTNKEAITPANLFEQSWLTCYPIPQILTYDRGTEFMAEFAKMIENDYGIKRKGTTDYSLKTTSQCNLLTSASNH
jgi:hypothetical protein